MNDNTPQVVLFSSDSNPQYEKDIYSVIALPYNGKYRFRYKNKYVDSESMQYLKKGMRVLIAFRSNSVTDVVMPFMVPIRWAEIEDVISIENKISIILFVAKEYPIFSFEYSKACKTKEGNIQFSEQYFRNSKGKDLFVSTVIPNFYTTETSNSINSKKQEEAWINIIEALSEWDNFKGKIFFKSNLDIPQDLMAFEMRENKRSTLSLYHYNSDSNGVASATVEVEYDPNVIISVTGEKETIECRYDLNTFSFIPKINNQEVESQITFNIKGDGKEEVKISIPIIIRRALKTKIISACVSFIGAACIGLNGILEDPKLGVSIFLFLVGSALVASAGLISKGD